MLEPAALAAARERTGWSQLCVGEATVRKGNGAVSLDFGGVAKGWCIEQVVRKLREAGLNDVLVEARSRTPRLPAPPVH